MNNHGRGSGWELRNSAWVLLSFVGLAWIGFFIIGKQAQNKKWLMMGGIYAAILIITFFLVAKWDVFVYVWMIAVLASIVHSFMVRKQFLKERDDVLRQREGSSVGRTVDIAPTPKATVDYPAEEKPTKNRAVTIDNDFFDDLNEQLSNATSESFDVFSQEQEETRATQVAINVNTCTEEELASLPGVSVVKAKKAVDYRNQNGGFVSVDEFLAVIAVQLHFQKQIEGMVCCDDNGPAVHANSENSATVTSSKSVSDSATNDPT